MRVLIAIAVVSGVAHADVDLTRVTRDLRAVDFAMSSGLQAARVLEGEGVDAMVGNAAWSFEAHVGAAIDGGGSALATVGAEAAYDMAMCRIVGGSFVGGLGGDSISWRARAEGCLPLPVDLIWAYLEHVENTRASMFDGVVLIRERRTQDYLGWHGEFLRHVRKDRQLDVFPADFVVTRDSAETTGSISILDWHRKGRGLDGGPQTFRFLRLSAYELGDPQVDPSGEPIAGARQVSAGNVVPVVVEGMSLFPGTAIDLALGYGDAARRENDRVVYARNGVHADASLRFTFDAVRGRIRGTHAMHATYGLQIVKEDRLAAELQRDRSGYTISSEAFVARQTVIRSEPGGGTVVASGAAFDGAVALGRGIALAGRVEAGRALDAARVGDPVRATWDVRATLGLDARFRGGLQ